MIYVDTSALVKLLVEEPESAELAAWLSQRETTPRVSSALVRVELRRAVGTRDHDRMARAEQLIRALTLVPLGHDLLDDAGGLHHALKSLDSIHLASAIRLRPELVAFVSYDKRLLDAAERAGLATAAPGAS